MLSSKSEAMANRKPPKNRKRWHSFVSRQADLAANQSGNVALATPPPVAPLKTRTKEVGFQVLTGSASIVVEALEAGASGAILGFAACAPASSLPGGLPRLERSRPEASRRETGPHRSSRPAHRRPARHRRAQARLRLQRLLRRPRPRALAFVDCGTKVRGRFLAGWHSPLEYDAR